MFQGISDIRNPSGFIQGMRGNTNYSNNNIYSDKTS